MATASLDVVGIGNAIVDIIAQADDAFLAAMSMVKGSMSLIDEARAEAIYAGMGAALETSGGSAGNTIAGVASLGGRTGYIGKVRDDLLGQVFRHDITAAGVEFPTQPATDGPSTARSLILVTPDAQRTMNTFLGACVNLGPADIDEQLIARAQVTYLEGYLFDPPDSQEAFRKAAGIARGAGRKVALSLSDSFCVVRHRTAFLELIGQHVDLVFGNESEVIELFESADFDAAVRILKGCCPLAAVTRGATGSVIVTPTEILSVTAAPVSRVVDTTGAGDLYAAGFLWGLTQGMPLTECGRIASLAAAEVISHYGPRPQTPLKDYIRAA